MYFYLEVNVCCSIFLRLFYLLFIFFFFSSRRRHTRYWRDWSSNVCSSDLYQDALRDELIQYASTHADNKDYHLMTPPRVRFETEDSLRFGEFGITAKLTGGTGPRAEDAPQDTSGQTRIFRTEETGGARAQGTSAISPEEAEEHGLAREVVELVLDHRTYPLEGRGPWSIGRSQECDIVVPDPNVSRRHARLLRADNGFVVEDLGSTNGTLLDGAPIDRERIESGDELTFGQSTARFVRRINSPGEPARGGRSEERRVGKECRSRW